MAVAEAAFDGEKRMSIYKVTRSIKKKRNSIYNSLRSIYEDSVFVSEIAGLWPELPLVANLRCGLWYSPRFDATCYFKSTDGHANNCSFSTARLNLHLAQLAGQKGGCIIVDSTRKGKRFPDSMSKTIPIWVCVLNRAIARWHQRIRLESQNGGESEFCSSSNEDEAEHILKFWDCSLHLPVWVPDTVKATIENRLEEWIKQLEGCGADIGSVASFLRKPLRPLWISQRTLIWLNEVPEYDSWDFTPIILISASATNGIIQQRNTSEFSWHYIPGAGDDEESWARGLSPNLFWKHVYDLIDSGPDLCNQKVSEIVEKERVYHSVRGVISPQNTVRPHKSSGDASFNDKKCFREPVTHELLGSSMNVKPSDDKCHLSWIGSTNIAVGKTSDVLNLYNDVDSVLNCDSKSISFCSTSASSYLHLPILTSKFDRFSLINSLSSAVDFAKMSLTKERKLLVCCHDGEDISICVCLAIVSALFDETGFFDGGKSMERTGINKWEMRKRLVYVCKFAVNARPSKGNLKQVFGFLSREKASDPSA